jgi:hypothetical protein
VVSRGVLRVHTRDYAKIERTHERQTRTNKLRRLGEGWSDGGERGPPGQLLSRGVDGARGAGVAVGRGFPAAG